MIKSNKVDFVIVGDSEYGSDDGKEYSRSSSYSAGKEEEARVAS